MASTATHNRRWVDVLAPVLLIALTTASSLRQEDIRFWDESMYLERGLTLGFSNQPGWEWNPLYADMYWLLSRFFGDPIDVYFAGRATSAVLIVLAVWLSLRLFARASIAIAGGVLMATLPITYVWPGVSSPSAAFILVAIAVMWRWRTPIALTITTALSWLAAATRPEFVWIAILVTVIVGIWLTQRTFRGSIRVRHLVALLASLLTAPVILAIGYGNPTELGTRSWEAFEQHYELRFATADDDPWQIDADVVGRDFPGAQSIPAAAMANPSALGQHMARNAVTLPISAGGHFVGLGGDDSPQNFIGVLAAGIWILALVGSLIRPRRPLGNFLRGELTAIREESARLPATVTLVLLGASLISALIIYPRPHYLVILVATGIAFTGVAIDRLGKVAWIQWVPSFLTMGIGVATLLFSIFALVTQPGSKTYASALRIMNESDTSWRLLTPERPISIFLDRGTQVLEVDQDFTSFADLLNQEDINAVFDGILLRQASWSGLKDFQEFLDDPGSFGFRSISPGSPFLVRDP